VAKQEVSTYLEECRITSIIPNYYGVELGDVEMDGSHEKAVCNTNVTPSGGPSDENTIFLVASLSKSNLELLLTSLSIFNSNITLIISVPPNEMPAHIPIRNTFLMVNNSDNFGDAYNQLVSMARRLTPKYLMLMNDDIVFEKDTIIKMYNDYLIAKHLIDSDFELGWLAARSNYIRLHQNIRYNWEQSCFNGLRFESEEKVFQVPVISPVLGLIALDCWIDFPPINWYSDDIQCLDMDSIGLRHFVSTAYCHHFGSQTTGRNHQKLHQDAMAWIKIHRPDFATLFSEAR
jgi:hypothetical protein